MKIKGMITKRVFKDEMKMRCLFRKRLLPVYDSTGMTFYFLQIMTEMEIVSLEHSLYT